VNFERDKAIANIQKIAPQAQIFEVSAKTGKGIKSLQMSS
jgi:hydrogenase nickel incorporation protein HypB